MRLSVGVLARHCGLGLGRRRRARAEERRHPEDVLRGQSAQHLDPRRGDDLDRRALHGPLQQPRRLRSADAAEQPRDDPARPGRELGVERRRQEAHLQAASACQVARRQALHLGRREVHLGHADRQERDPSCARIRASPGTGNLEEVTTNGDREVTFHLGQPQPSLLVLLASGYSPVYSCHVPTAQMRTKPIGTGPFKLAEFKQKEIIKLARNPDYFKKGKPYLDAHRDSDRAGARHGDAGLRLRPLRHDGALCRHHPAAEGRQGAGADAQSARSRR